MTTARHIYLALRITAQLLGLPADEVEPQVETIAIASRRNA